MASRPFASYSLFARDVAPRSFASYLNDTVGPQHVDPATKTGVGHWVTTLVRPNLKNQELRAPKVLWEQFLPIF